MILKASQRSGAAALADHLMNSLDNDHIELLETRGFMAEDLHGALPRSGPVAEGSSAQALTWAFKVAAVSNIISSDCVLRSHIADTAVLAKLTDNPSIG